MLNVWKNEIIPKTTFSLQDDLNQSRVLCGKSTNLIIEWRPVELELWKESLDQNLQKPESKRQSTINTF